MVKSSIGDFQANVGKASADVGVVGAYVMGSILIIIGIVMGIMALIPRSPTNCDVENSRRQASFQCTPPVVSQINCVRATKTLAQEQQRCSSKRRNLWLLLGLLLIPLAMGLVWYSRWWRHLVHHNRGAAQVGGAMAEINIAESIFDRN